MNDDSLPVPAEPSRGGGKSSWRWWLLALFFCVALGGGGALLRRGFQSAPAAPPKIPLAGYDPQIVATIEEARAGVVQTPRSGAAWGKLGSVLMVNKLREYALTCFAEAERLEPHEPRWPYLGSTILLVHQPDAALPKLQRAVELAGEETTVPRLRLANFFLDRGRYDDAERLILSVLEVHPDESHAALGLGRLEFARGHISEAVKHLETAAKNPQTTKASLALLATAQQRLGNPSGAEEIARRAASLPNDPPMIDPYVQETAPLATGKEALLDRADRLLKAGKNREAVQIIERITAANPKDAVAWQLLGWARLSGQRYVEAETALRRALELAQDVGETHFELGVALLAQRKHAPAAAAFRRSIELRPNYPAAHYDLGLCFEQLGQRTDAIEAFRTAIRYGPDLVDAHKRLGGNLALQGLYKEALEPLRRALELKPADAEVAKMVERAELRLQEQ